MPHRTLVHRPPISRTALRRTLGAAAAAGAVAVAAPAAGAASIWTPLASGTGETITSLSYRPGQLIFGTANGKLFTQAGGQRASFPGQAVIDVAVSPSGTTALAVLDSGKVVRSTDAGATWSAPLQLQTFDFPACQNAPGAAAGSVDLPSAPTAVRFASDTVAYIVSNVPGSVLKSNNGGVNWTDVSRRPDRTCRVQTSDPITDVATIVGSDSAYFITKSFGNTFFTADALASTASDRGTSVNCFDQKPALAVDSADGTRLVAGDGCTGILSLQYSEDGGTTFNRPELAPEDVKVNGINDVAFTAGTAIWAGKAGDVFTSRDGRTAYAQKVEGADATRDWRAVSGFSANDAAIAGVGGALYVTTTASAIPAPTPAPTPVVTPRPTPPATVPGTTPGGISSGTIPGASFTLSGPSACVPTNGTFAAKMSMRRIAIKNNRIVKLTRVDFSVDGKRVKIDRKAPFRQTLTIKKATAGSLHTLKATGYVKVKRGKAPKRTQTVKFAICG